MSLFADFRFGVRMLIKNPGFSLVALLALTLGIGVNAMVFTVTNVVLFKGFPFDRSDRIAYLGTRNLGQSGRYYSRWGPSSYADLHDWRAQAKTFAEIGAASGAQTNLSDDKNFPDMVRGTQMTANGFHVIGQKPLVGRDFTAADEAPGAPRVAILGYGLWERRYAKSRDTVGRNIRLDGVPATVIGIMPQGMTFPFDGELWYPLIPTPEAASKREVRNLLAFGRMAEGVTLPAARAEMEAIGRNLAAAYPATNQNFATVVLDYNQLYLGPEITTIFLAMMVGVLFVLLIACANVANLQLARGVARAREISMRIALGAGRWRLVRQLLVESLILSTAGGVLGWLVGLVGVRLFDAQTKPYGKPTWMVFTMDYRAFAYLVVISIGTGICFGLVPALRLSKLDINTGLKDGGHGSGTGGRGRRLAGLLVMGEMALAIVLLAGAGLMIRTFLSVYRAQIGVDTASVLTMRVGLPNARYPQPRDQVAFQDRLKTRLDAIPGVETTAIANTLPTGGSLPFSYELADAPSADPLRRPTLAAVIVSPDYFRALDARMLAGREFSAGDGVTGPPSVIVNQRFAERTWPGQQPIGKRLRIFTGGSPEAWLTVVGIAPNIVQNDIAPREIDPLIYLPYRQKPLADMAILARTRVPPSSLGNAFRHEIQSMDGDLPIYNLWTLRERLERNYWFYRVFGELFLLFAGIALLLASVGLYAVMAHSVGQRTQEIGVRMAMGATPGRILQLVFVNGMRQVAIGLGVGLAGAFLLMRVLKSVLVQVSPSDPGTFATAAGVLIVAALLGCFVPAYRATRVDPISALHHE